MAFLLKCLLCILIVCVALEWRPAASPHVGVRAQAAAPAPPRRPRAAAIADHKEQETHAGAALLRAGTRALTDAARARCLSAPEACLAALERLGASAPRPR